VAATRVSFFTDPACPWAWITSRWVEEVATERDLEVRWRSFSPEVRDGGVRLSDGIPRQLRVLAGARRSVAAVALRVLEVVRHERGEAAVGRFYTEFGYRLNDPGRSEAFPEPRLIAAALVAAGLDPDLERVAADPEWQTVVATSTRKAMAIVGLDAATPVIVLDDEPAVGVSGPVISAVPERPAGLQLWDTFAVLAANASFIEMRRARSIPRLPTRGSSVGQGARRSA
jgi:2-hydroxychromene-2-carboxylate isomerase